MKGGVNMTHKKLKHITEDTLAGLKHLADTIVKLARDEMTFEEYQQSNTESNLGKIFSAVSNKTEYKTSDGLSKEQTDTANQIANYANEKRRIKGLI